jgi:hypothetical protein
MAVMLKISASSAESDFGEGLEGEVREADYLRIHAKTRQESWMSQVKGAVSKVWVQGVN